MISRYAYYALAEVDVKVYNVDPLIILPLTAIG